MRTIVVIGTGPSVTFDAIDYIRHSHCDVMVINETFMVVPWADYLYAADPTWWEQYADCVESTFHGERFCVDVPDKTYQGIDYKKIFVGVNRENGTGGLELDPDVINNGGNSGHAALNVCYHLRYERIILLGLDGQGAYWFNTPFRAKSICKEPQPSTRVSQAKTLNDMIKDLLDKGVVVHNCSSEALHLPLQRLEDVL